MEKIDESWFDQMRARVKGKLAKYGAIGKGVKSFIKQDLDIEAFKDIDPLEIERLTRVISILDPYQEKFRKLYAQFQDDSIQIQQLLKKTAQDVEKRSKGRKSVQDISGALMDVTVMMQDAIEAFEAITGQVEQKLKRSQGESEGEETGSAGEEAFAGAFEE